MRGSFCEEDDMKKLWTTTAVVVVYNKQIIRRYSGFFCLIVVKINLTYLKTFCFV